MNAYSHTPALPSKTPVRLDDSMLSIDRLDPAELFTLFFSDVTFSEEIQDVDFSDALTEMPPPAKDETKATIYAALSEIDPDK